MCTWHLPLLSRLNTPQGFKRGSKALLDSLNPTAREHLTQKRSVKEPHITGRGRFPHVFPIHIIKLWMPYYIFLGQWGGRLDPERNWGLWDLSIEQRHPEDFQWDGHLGCAKKKPSHWLNQRARPVSLEHSTSCICVLTRGFLLAWSVLLLLPSPHNSSLLTSFLRLSPPWKYVSLVLSIEKPPNIYNTHTNGLVGKSTRSGVRLPGNTSQLYHLLIVWCWESLLFYFFLPKYLITVSKFPPK